MWLLHTFSRKLTWFTNDDEIGGKYAILSHTWDEDEVKFADIADLDKAKLKAGYKKIDYTCKEALLDGYEYAWIDTCCINKADSSELSEAINSMFRWYRNAGVCYVYIGDRDMRGRQTVDDRSQRKRSTTSSPTDILKDCRWLRRGWTLQELIAPSVLVFFDQSWHVMGKVDKNAEPSGKQGTRRPQDYELPGSFKEDIAASICTLTGIPWEFLRQSDAYRQASVARRLCWAAQRSTTRIEDRAYCLLGILEVTMPLLYGEGSKAFLRLQEELLRTTSDQSLLAWKPQHEDQYRLLLAPDPKCFEGASGIECKADISQDGDHALTNRGLRSTFILAGAQHRGHYRVRLNCKDRDEKDHIWLRVQSVGRDANDSPGASPRVFEIVRDPPSMSKRMENMWLMRTEVEPTAYVSDAVLLKTGANRTISLEAHKLLAIRRAGFPSVGQFWHPALSSFIVPPHGADATGWIEVEELQSHARKLLVLQNQLFPGANSPLYWIDIPAGWGSDTAMEARDAEALTRDIGLVSRFHDEETSWEIPGSFDVTIQATRQDVKNPRNANRVVVSISWAISMSSTTNGIVETPRIIISQH